jgi:hypothetical protein
MKAGVSFVLFPLALLSACIMETPKVSNGALDGPHFLFTDRFDFVSSDFNRAAFDSQRALWQERDYTDYEGVLHLSTWDNSWDNSEAPYDFYWYRCEFVVKAGQDPEVVWFEGHDTDLMLPLEGALPEDFPSVYTIEGIYDYILAVIENLAVRVKEENEGFSVCINYWFDNTPNRVMIYRLENGVYHTFREIALYIRHPPRVKRPEMSVFDRETFEQEYHAWKELGVKNYRYSLSIKDSFMDGPESVTITVRDGKEPEVSGDTSFLKDYTIDGVFDLVFFIASMLKDPSYGFVVAYWPEYHIPAKLVVFDYEDPFIFMTLDSFEMLTE